MRKSIILAVAAIAATGSLAFAATTLTVDQKGLAFDVPTLTVNRGDVVTFINSDITSHNIVVTGDGVRLNSGLQAPGVAFHAPFMKSGTYLVACAIHPRMKMSVIVK